MEIVPFRPDMAEGVTRLYNELIEPVPDCHPVPVDRFASVEALASTRLRDERLVVALHDGEVAGFAHVGVALPVEHYPVPTGEPAAVRFLGYRPGQRAVGRRLLEWAEEYARQQDRGTIEAWHYFARYPFYHCPWGQLSERMAHIRALFGMAGYAEADDGQLYFNWHDFDPPKPQKPVIELELKPEWKEGPLGPRMDLRAMQGETELGMCRMDRGQTSPSPEAQDWCYCDGMWVQDELQGKRLGMLLLVCALREMKKAGCRHAAISTSWKNYRAALFYTNLGYRFADQTYGFRKELAE
ncbi:MAG TPA: GNAT family N-acetyltransferase [Armatimonadota bacterium]|nr:GNAT family N-acetyltransferase [Armatimonadota bacterium]